ncbi:MAG: DNA/RNA non-specific endonuclease, partial [Coriobacteriia bacterium]|nr:DNA/RNA non-specific endonuclease [Coriobacteriia bacterium]
MPNSIKKCVSQACVALLVSICLLGNGFALLGCSSDLSPADSEPAVQPDQSSAEANLGSSEEADSSQNADAGKEDEAPAPSQAKDQGNKASKAGSSSKSYVAHSWSFKKYPLYYKVWGRANTSVSVSEGETILSDPDSLGRTRRVVAKVTYDMVKQSAGWRESMTDECNEISGWGHQKKVSVKLSNGRTYRGYAWNRSHLLADCLGGHAGPDNLVTGTRTQNVGNNSQQQPGGMQYTETQALEYLRLHHSGWVYYRATPVYKGDELVCRSVYVDIKSDDGSIDEHVEVFNAMKGCTIDYDTGKISGDAVEEVGQAASKAGSSAASRSSGDQHELKHD